MALFDEACELPRTAIAGFLSGLPQADQALRRQLAAMLEVDEQSQVFFDQTRGGALALARDLVETPTGQATLDAPVPAKIGEYEILERIGVGGMGSVYRAQQHNPERVVALKTLHPWLVTPSSLERFRFEAQALASLKHPFIPPVFTVGQHEGAVYFAMELVHGPPLMKWARDQAPSLAVRVRVLAEICDAVHHAHLRGFVHRDLKPDNIRVTDDGTPRVLDFGISAGLGERSGEIAGTPAYMSPEQLEPSAVVDVRSDVFSLGVIAFELLGGQVPVVPPKSGLATLQAVKQAPAPRLRSVAPGLGGELDAIVARALEVNPEQRYASVAELGADLRRLLAREPVEAYRGGRLYRLVRFVQRNAFVVGAVSAVVVALVVGVAVSLSQYVTAERARKQAATDAERARSSLEFLTNVLQQADTDNAGGRGATIGSAIDAAVARLSKGELDPHVEATLRASLANTYVGMGEWTHATEQATLALAAYQQHHLEDDEELGEVLRVVSEVRIEAGDLTGAVEAGERGLTLEEHFHGAEAHPHLSYSLHVAAIADREQGQFERALLLHRRAVAMERTLAVKSGSTNDLSDTLDQYGLTLVTLGRYDEARAVHLEALKLTLATFGPDHQNAAIGYAHLAWLEAQAGTGEAARPWLDQALKVRLATLGPEHVRIGIQRNAEALMELQLGHVERAAWAIDECLRIAKKAYGETSGRGARLSSTKVRVLLAQGKAAEALALSEQLLAFVRPTYGAEHAITSEARSNHAAALLATGAREAGLAELQEVQAALKKTFCDDRPWVVRLTEQRLKDSAP